jgi:energy-converting hydrogenase Eha subunit H
MIFNGSCLFPSQFGYIIAYVRNLDLVQFSLVILVYSLAVLTQKPVERSYPRKSMCFAVV